MVNPLSILWTGRCTIYEYRDVTDPETYQTTQQEVPVLVDEPCRLSYNYEQSTNVQSGAAIVSQSITLFIRPDLTINPGSVIEITQNNITERYKGSGSQRCIQTTKKLSYSFMRITRNEGNVGL